MKSTAFYLVKRRKAVFVFKIKKLSEFLKEMDRIITYEKYNVNFTHNLIKYEKYYIFCQVIKEPELKDPQFAYKGLRFAYKSGIQTV
ncbi:hypothetical protein DBR28_05360 [Chryseobacterium sp. HMWF028]|nr:hypothetical protein DBR28_05360 [Chryseobacterium sp. HMWF028]